MLVTTPPVLRYRDWLVTRGQLMADDPTFGDRHIDPAGWRHGLHLAGQIEDPAGFEVMLGHHAPFPTAGGSSDNAYQHGVVYALVWMRFRLYIAWGIPIVAPPDAAADGQTYLTLWERRQ